MKYDIFISCFLTCHKSLYKIESQRSNFSFGFAGPLGDSIRPDELFISGMMMILNLFPRE